MAMKLGYNDPDYALEEAAPTQKSSTPAPAAPVAPASTTAPGMSWGDYQGFLGSNWSDMAPAWNSTDLVHGFGQLAQQLGISGPVQERTGRQIGAGFTNEGGSENLVDEWGPSSGLSSALSGYRFSPSMDSDENPTVQVYDSSGTPVGNIRVGSSPGSLHKFASVAIPALVTAGFGAGLAPLALGAAGIGGAAGAGGLSAATLNAMAAGTIGSTLNTAVQGGNAQDYLRGIATAAAMPVINSALTKLPGISSGVNYASKAVEDALQGAPQSFINTAAALPQNIVQGAARGLITGDVFGGISDAVLGQITQDVAPSLGLTEPQARALAKWGRDQDTNALVMSLGSGLAKQAMGSVQDAIKQQGIEQAYNDPSRALDVLPEEARAYTPETYDPNAPVTGGTDFDLNALLSTLPYEVQNSALGVDLGQPEPTPELPQVNITGPKAGTPEYDSTYYGDYGGFAEPTPELPQVNITGQKPVDAGFDLDALLSTLPYEVQNSALGVDLGQPEPVQQAVIRGERPPEDDLLDLIGIGGDYGGNPPPISPGQTPQQIAITEKKPVVEDELDLPPYKYTIPELPLLEPPKVEIEKPTAPPLGGGPTTPTTPSKGIDINSLLNLLGGGGQEPVLSQVLAQMPGFDVESMSQYMREQRRKKAPDQQTQLAELFANIGYRG